MTILTDIKKHQLNAQFPQKNILGHAHAALAPCGTVTMRSTWRAEGLDAVLSSLSARHTAAMKANALMQAFGGQVMAKADEPGHDPKKS